MTRFAFLVATSLALAACGLGPDGLAPAPAPHEAYADALRDSGLDSTRAGRLWLAAADSALEASSPLSLPAAADTRFVAGRPSAWSVRLDVRAGEVVRATVVLSDSARLFVDLFASDSTGHGRLLGAVATHGDTLVVEQPVTADGVWTLRVQPELLVGATAWLRVEARPSLGFPVAGASAGDVGSGWGAPRDAGARRHEGIDVFAPRGTPVVAVADGRVTRVEETPRGGRVVWLRPTEAPLSLYYAHLDAQTVEAGQRVAAGDTLGTVGTTGNASGTPPHLHFGLYGRGGAVDPAPFVIGRPGG